MRALRIQTVVCCAGVLAAVIAHATQASAQAFVPPKGEGAVSFVFQDAFVKYHLLPTVRVDRGQIRTNTMLIDASIGLGHNLAVSFAVPFVRARYTGSSPHRLLAGETAIHPDFAFLDDGGYHGAVQDLRFDVRYNAVKGRVFLTPFVAAILPSHQYEHFAHAAVGRRVRELQVGVFVARLLDPMLPGGFVQARYSYGLAERVLDISHNRSNLSLEAGYFVNQSLRVFVIGMGQVTHGGIDLTAAGRAAIGSERYIHHDQISRDNQANVGAGLAYSLTDTVDVFGSVMKTVAARNGHLLARSVSVGVSFGFGRKYPTMGGGGDDACVEVEDALARCVCLRK